MFITEIEQRSLDELKELRRRHHKAALALRTTGDTAVTRMLAFVTTELGERWEKDAPKLTGTLKSATRERIFDETGRVFIDPSIENPVLGGLPSIYGPVVHRRNPWVANIMANDAEGILVEGNSKLFREISDIYR